MKRFSYLMLFFALPLIAEWQYPSSLNIMNPQQGWVKRYGGPSWDVAYCVQPTNDSGYVVVGYSGPFGKNKIWLLRLDSSGDTIWTRTYGGEKEALGMSVRQIQDNGFVICGWINAQPYLIRTDSSGDTLWTKIFNTGERGMCWCVQETTDDNYVICGGEYGSHPFLIRISPTGDSLWGHRYSFTGRARCVRQTADGGYVLTGTESSDGLTILKTDSNGVLLWSKEYDGLGKQKGFSIIPTEDGGYLITGRLSQGLWVIKTDEKGDSLWSHIYGGFSFYDEGHSIEIVNGGYIIGGKTNTFAGDGGSEVDDYWLLRLDTLGDTLWTRVYGLDEDDECHSVAKAPDGGFVMAGSSMTFWSPDVWIIKTDSFGKGLPLEISPFKVIAPYAGGNHIPVTPKAKYINLGSDDYLEDFFCHCEIVDPVFHSNYYRDSVLVNGIKTWEQKEVEFEEWVSADTAYYTATFWATSATGDTLPTRPMSIECYLGGIEEQPQPETHPTFEVLTAVGNYVLLSSQSEERSHLSVYDASGRLVDEVVINGPSTIMWGEGFSPGVYFFRDVQGSQTQKAVLLK